MSNEELLGLMIGLGFLAAVAGYLANIWFHPDTYRWLELPQSGGKPALKCMFFRPVVK